MNANAYLACWPSRTIRVQTTGSTNEDAAIQLADGQAPDFAIVAAHQTSGRGRNGNAWQSLEGNLYLSVALDPDTTAARAGELAFVAANAVQRTVNDLTQNGDVQVKWPNDVLVTGRKIAGILIENRIESDRICHSIVGIGINVSHAPDLPGYAADCIANHNPNVTVDDALENILSSLRREFQLWHAEGFAPIRDRWIACAWRMGEIIAVATPRGHVSGVMQGIDADGALLVGQGPGITRISSGSLAYGPA